MSNEENIEPSQVKSVHVEENQERICFSSELVLNDQNTNENVDFHMTWKTMQMR